MTQGALKVSRSHLSIQAFDRSMIHHSPPEQTLFYLVLLSAFVGFGASWKFCSSLADRELVVLSEGYRDDTMVEQNSDFWNVDCLARK